MKEKSLAGISVSYFCIWSMRTCLFLTGVLFAGLLFAGGPSSEPDPVVPDGQTQTSIDQARNGTTIVNIAKPNEKGLSNNTYRDFNVPEKGIILNNSSTEGVSKIGGAVLGNPNFRGKEANLILNQITSNNASVLEGFTEVFGQKAGVIIANPNGISCSGCGFINTSRLLLGTGSADVQNGEFRGIDLDPSARVRVEGEGFNGAESVDYLELISRYHEIRGKLAAKKGIRILSGNDYYDESRRRVLSDDSLASGSGQIAVDISARSGLYAGQIVLIGTEKGLGVNNEAEWIAAEEDIVIDAAGSIVNKAMLRAQRDISLKSILKIAAGEPVSTSSGADADSSAQTGTTAGADSGVISAGGEVSFEAEELELNQNIGAESLLAQIRKDLINNAEVFAGDVKIRAGGDVHNNLSAVLAASENLSIEAANLTNRGETNKANAALIYSGKQMNLQIKEDFLNENAQVLAGENLYLSSGMRIDGLGNKVFDQAGSILNRGGTIESSGNMVLAADQITNEASVLPWVYEYGPYGHGGHNWKKIQNPELEANRGRILAGKNLHLQAKGGTISNIYSEIVSHEDAKIEGDKLKNISFVLQTSKEEMYWIERRKWKGNIEGWSGKDRKGYRSNKTNTGVVDSSIKAGGRITGNLKDSFTNTYDASTRANTASTPADPFAQGYVKQLIDANPGPLFRSAIGQGKPYLIETRPEFADLSNLFGSSYFFERTGFSAADHAPVLGDDYWMQRKIMDSVRQVSTGNYLGENIHSDEEQMQALIDAAAEQSEGLNLRPGVALSKDQIANLTKDMIWMVEEEVVIEGQTYKVLVPRLYLAKETRKQANKMKGAVVAARKINLSVGGAQSEPLQEEQLQTTWENALALTRQSFGQNGSNKEPELSANDKRLLAKLNPEQKKQLEALFAQGSPYILRKQFLQYKTSERQRLKEKLDALLAEYQNEKRLHARMQMGSFDNSSKPKKFKDPRLERQIGKLRGQISRIRNLEFDEDSAIKNYRLAVQKDFAAVLDSKGNFVNEGNILAVEDLSIRTQNHLTNHGNLEAGGAMSLNAGGDLQVASLYNEDSFQGGKQVLGAITREASLNAGGSLQMKSGGDIVMRAADIRAEGDTALTAERDIRLEAIGVRNKSTDYRTKGDYKYTTTTERINFKTSSIDTGGNLSISSGSNLISEGGAFKAGGNIVADVQGTIYNSEVQDVYSRSVEKEYIGDDSFVGSLAKMSSALTKVAITGGAALLDSGTLDELKEGIAGNNSEEENRSRTTARGGLFEAGGSIELGSKANQIYRGTDFKAGNDISLASEEGKVALLSIRDTENYSKTVKGKGALWQTDKGEGSYDESLKFGEMSAGGKINIRAKEGVDADIQKREITYYEETPYGRVKRTRKETNREAIDRMVAEDPSKAWMSSLYQSGDLTLTLVEEKHEDWQYDNSGMTKEAQLAVSIAVSAATGGVGGAVMGAGLSAMASTGAVNVINSVGRGDGLHSGLQATFSEDNLKAAGVAMVTAGAVQGLDSLAGVSKASQYGMYSNRFVQTAVHTTARTAINSAVYGTDFADSLRENLKNAGIDEVAAMGAGEIGDEFASGSMAGGPGSVDYWLHKGSHAALGCATASAKGGDCASGAFGGAAGEVFAEQLGKTGMSDKWLLASSRIATVFSAGAAGKDIKDADATASNAVQNNYLNHKEQFKRSQAKKACATGDMSACAKVEELNTLDETRDQILDEIRAECASEGPAGCSFNMMTEIADELTSVLNGYEENEGSFGSGSIREISSLENYLRIFKNDPYGEALQPGILAPEDITLGFKLLKSGVTGTKALLRMLRKPATYRTAVQKSKNTWIVGPKGGRAKATNYRDKNGNVVYERESGGYYVNDGGKQTRVNSPKDHGNKLGDQPAECYDLVCRSSGKNKKIGETTHGEDRYGPGNQKRYTRKYLDENNVDYEKTASGTKKEMNNLQNQSLKEYKEKHGQYPDMNKNGR